MPSDLEASSDLPGPSEDAAQDKAATPLSDAVCVGHAIVDWVSFVETGTAERLDLRPGAMTLVDREQAERIGSGIPAGRQVSGGSAANTAAGIASFGGDSAFVGAVGDDLLGAGYAADLEAAGVRCAVEVADAGTDAGTGRCFVLVTPDADRTMATYLGAAGAVRAETAARAGIATAAALYLEGYLFDAPRSAEALARARAIAAEAGTALALSLSDPFVVERHHDALAELVAHDVTLLFCNEDELGALTGASGAEAAAEAVRREGLTAFVTRGEKGVLAVRGAERVELPAAPVPAVVDTTGAGDLFAAGALFGLARGVSLEHAAALGALAASEVIAHAGARPITSLAQLAAAAGLLPG